MAGSVNKALITGRLGRDPEIKHKQNGDIVANLNVATSDVWKDKATGERKENTFWHNIVIYNENLAKVAQAYLHKGDLVHIEGAIQSRKYQDRDGNDRYITEIVLQKFRGDLVILESRKSDGASDQPRERVTERSAPARDDFADQEIPF
ncbi:single-stranded DNA-binding protein [Chelatococcus sp. YT9]|uniref:single-stranded DNA-binding protein n=1 Tax=Chelatococcus sp. YT9 TaxID=2835635 RepID=UPI001BCE9D02|nr:single-stranded DNA-binding protein [Chelatococcus sp. YT9]MBS7698573.1 single-stranded DNA-binding protein [Chelatococcus sp. YT9]